GPPGCPGLHRPELSGTTGARAYGTARTPREPAWAVGDVAGTGCLNRHQPSGAGSHGSRTIHRWAPARRCGN
ncbi:hypothetical protein ABZ498_32170, partial [Streptomyces lavendulocolor]|uniref:hypothetical protein n=1 Tax=Streptomyces lavendulocolor TaxID=67316 RepID=UPI0033C0BC8F